MVAAGGVAVVVVVGAGVEREAARRVVVRLEGVGLVAVAVAVSPDAVVAAAVVLLVVEVVVVADVGEAVAGFEVESLDVF